MEETKGTMWEVLFVKVIYFQKRCKKVRESLGVFWAKIKVTLNEYRDIFLEAVCSKLSKKTKVVRSELGISSQKL